MSALQLTWKVDNPDQDDLRYRLSYRMEGQSTWRSLLKPKLRRMRAHVLLRELAARNYRWERFVEHPNAWYRAKVQELCGDMPEVAARIAVKQPSSGLMAVVLADHLLRHRAQCG